MRRGRVTGVGVASAAFVVALWAGCVARGFKRFPEKPIRWRTCERTLARAPSTRKPDRWAVGLRRTLAEPLDRMLSLRTSEEAGNVNRLDLTADSSWFTNRLGLGSAPGFYGGSGQNGIPGSELADHQIAEGGARTTGPSALGKWDVVRAGTDRSGPYLAIRDVRNRNFLLRFDAKGFLGLGTAAELVSTLLLHAAGYHVPERHMVFFMASRLRLNPSAHWTRAASPWDESGSVRRKKKKLTRAALAALLKRIPTERDGSYRATATRITGARELGPFPLVGTRSDDPNDRTEHTRLRELRGLRLVAAWLNLTGMDEFTSADLFDRGRVVHTLRHLRLGMGSTAYGHPKPLGSGLGGILFPRGWSRRLSAARKRALGKWPAVGWFPVLGFLPRNWTTATTHPCFARATDRDLFWAGRILSSFTEARIRPAVQAAMLEPETGRLLVRVLAERARIVGRFGLSRGAPFGFFRVRGGSGGRPVLCLTDLYRTAGYDRRGPVGNRVQVMTLSGKRCFDTTFRSDRPRFCVPLPLGRSGECGRSGYLVVFLRRNRPPARTLRVHLLRSKDRSPFRVVGVER